MQELGFRPSYAGRSLRDGRYHSVGLCINDVTKFGNLSMIDGIASAAREHNCAITLVEMSKTEEFLACRGHASYGRIAGGRHHHRHEPHGARF